MKILLATRNPGKVREVGEILEPTGLEVEDLSARAEFEGRDVAETGTTFLQNALIKARWAAELSGGPAVADDSGLEVDALGGAPGVRSARYAGDEATDLQNNEKLIRELNALEEDDRSARFRCVAVLFVPNGAEAGVWDGLTRGAVDAELEGVEEGTAVHLDGGVAVAFTGVVEGVLIDDPRGDGGFGYDPHFFLPELGCTTAELPAYRKNALSHRGQAFRKLADAIGG